MKKSVILIFLLIANTALADDIKAKYADLKNGFFEKPNPADAVWDTATQIPVQLLPQNITTPGISKTTVPDLKVQALHNGKWLAVRLQWHDATENFHVETDQASDACAIQLPLKEADKTSPFMGDKNHPVEIIHWKAVWQNDVENGFQKVTDLYPNTWVDTYQFGKDVARSAGNPISLQERTLPVEELIAGGFGTLTHQSSQDAMAWGKWDRGQWTVVFTHELNSGDSADPVLKPGDKTVLAFAIWEGASGNVGARKNFAPWVPLILEKK